MLISTSNYSTAHLDEFFITEDVLIDMLGTEQKGIAVVCHHSIHESQLLEHSALEVIAVDCG